MSSAAGQQGPGLETFLSPLDDRIAKSEKRLAERQARVDELEGSGVACDVEERRMLLLLLADEARLLLKLYDIQDKRLEALEQQNGDSDMGAQGLYTLAAGLEAWFQHCCQSWRKGYQKLKAA